MEHDVLTVRREAVARQPVSRVVLGRFDQAREELLDDGDAVVVERARVVNGRVWGQDGETGVDVVEIGILQPTQIYCSKIVYKRKISFKFQRVPLDHLLLDSAPNLGPLISRWEINKFENC